MGLIHMSQLGAIKIYRHSSKVTIYAFFFFEIVPAKLATLGRQLRFSEIRFFFFFFWRKGSQVTSYRKLPRALQTLDSLQLTSCVAGKLKSYTTVKILWRYYNFLTRFLLVEICSGRSVTDIKLRNSKPYNFHSRFL